MKKKKKISYKIFLKPFLLKKKFIFKIKNIISKN